MVIKEAQKKAEVILIKHKDLLEKAGQRLVEKEIIEREEYENIINSK